MKMMTETENDKAIKELANLMWQARMRRKKVLLLAGCGLSKAASRSIPCLPTLIKNYCERIGRNDLCTEIDQNKAIINNILSNLSKDGEMNKKEWRKTIEEFAIEVQNADPTDPAHTSIKNLWEKGYINWIFCLNYDDLIERSFGRENCEIIRTHSNLMRFLQTLSNKLPLIKAHGDLWMMKCPNPKCGSYKTVPTSTPNELYRGEKCDKCDTPLDPYAAMPDSARSASVEFVSSLRKKIKEFDLIICVGFSGEYDTHITDMIEESKKFARTKICKIDPIKTRLSDISDIKIDLYAEDAFTQIQETLEGLEVENKENKKGLSLAFSHTLFDPIYQTIPLTDIEWKIRKNQRFRGLQWIYQLGLKYCKFIGARHSRFEHSLGTMQVADEIYIHLQEDNDKRNADERQLLRLGALLHDIGHVCFGHLGEETIKELGVKDFSHVKFADEIIKRDSGLKNILEEFFENSYYIYDDIIKLINGNSGILILDKIIDSPYDADKLEYLLRDSKMTGREYGIELDKSTFLNNLVIRSNDLFIKEEGTSALERIAEARYHMYKEVYANADVRGYESMFKKVLMAWIRDKHSKEFKLESTEWINDFLKSDDVIMTEITEDVGDAWKKRGKTNKVTFWKGGEDKLKFVKKVLDIVGGAEELPKPLVINIKAEDGIKPHYIKEILRSLSSIEDEFRYDVIIDTYFFDPLGSYKNEPFIIREDDKLYKLSDLSPLVNSIKNAYDYKIRIYLIDESKREKIVDRIGEELKDTKIMIME